VIFGIHLQPLARICFVAGIVVVIVGSLNPQLTSMPFQLSDKLVHVVAYALLGVAGAVGYPRRSMTALLIVGLTVFGIAIEIAQIYVPGRDGTLLDVAANALGSVLGVVGGRRITRRR
jgi:VanZ family protein